MKEKTEWKQPAINTMPDRWESSVTPSMVFFLGWVDLKWVNFYSRKVGNTSSARAGQILGDE